MRRLVSGKLGLRKRISCSVMLGVGGVIEFVLGACLIVAG